MVDGRLLTAAPAGAESAMALPRSLSSLRFDAPDQFGESRIAAQRIETRIADDTRKFQRTIFPGFVEIAQ